ncbi:hypothetical protein B0H13DRAFT_2371953 [Mycena leptocephala]|nr:hypothetical protein B0H13DRAFT_2371953 [Mycena leptocephala]
MIVRKFANYRNQVYLKSDAAQPSFSVSELKKSNPLLKFSLLMTGRELFTRDNHHCISSAIHQRSLDTGIKNSATLGEDQSVWNNLAEAEVRDVGKNQEEFANCIKLALRELCRKLLGDAEMVLFYAFREPAGGDLRAGMIHGHSVHNQVHFGGSHEELELQYGQAWSDFAKRVIPLQGEFLTGEENDDLDQNFSQRKLSHSLRSLESYIGNLEWTFLTDVDIAVLSEPVPDEVTQAVLHALWEKLSMAAKGHEQCACAIGWLAHMVLRKSSTEVSKGLALSSHASIVASPGPGPSHYVLESIFIRSPTQIAVRRQTLQR